MERNILALLAPGRGILAADESVPTIGRRFQALGLTNDEGTRLAWRTHLLGNAAQLKALSGVILSADSTSLLSALASRNGLQVGIKVDEGTAPLDDGAPGELATQGLDGLAARCRKFRSASNLTFAKWRAVFSVSGDGSGRDGGSPSEHALTRNAGDLAEFAAVMQGCGLVPVVEPEVLVGEGSHGMAASQRATERVLLAVAAALDAHPGVDPALVIIKPNMVLPGRESGEQPSQREVAAATLAALAVLRRALPSLPGVAFLSGGQGEADAARHLRMVVAMAAQLQEASNGAGSPHFVHTFSYGRALQSTALSLWAEGRAEESGDALTKWSKANSCATRGLPPDCDLPRVPRHLLPASLVDSWWFEPTGLTVLSATFVLVFMYVFTALGVVMTIYNCGVNTLPVICIIGYIAFCVPYLMGLIPSEEPYFTSVHGKGPPEWATSEL